MAELIVKKISNPFVKEEPINKVELSLYSNLIKKNTKNDNSDIVKDLYSQLIDIKENTNNK